MKNTYRRLLPWMLWIAIGIICCCIVFLRFYNIPTHLNFLSDQGRDAIVLKRLVTFEKFVFVGPTTSIGNVFTGPFYYYLVAPFMALWKLYPSGPAYGVALINTSGLFFLTYAVKKLFGGRVSILFLMIAGFATTQVVQSRFSWNPNPVPVFTFGALIVGYMFMQRVGRVQYVQRQAILLAIITGILFGCGLQLHYITILLLFPFGIEYMWIHSAWREKVKLVVIASSATLITFTPMILFEIKNKFIIIQTLLRARNAGEIVAKNFYYHERLADTVVHFYTYAFGLPRILWIDVTIILGMIVFIVWYSIRKLPHASFVRMCAMVILFWFPLFARLETGRHMHYYNAQYLPAYFLLALFGGLLSQKIRVVGNVLVTVALGYFIYTQVTTYQFIFHTKPTTQLSDAELVARYIITQVKNKDAFQVVGLPFYEVEGHYRYFLEYLNYRPMSADTLGDPKQLFVICHDVIHCKIAGDPQWQLADYQNRHPKWKIMSSKKIADVTVYAIQ